MCNRGNPSRCLVHKSDVLRTTNHNTAIPHSSDNPTLKIKRVLWTVFHSEGPEHLTVTLSNVQSSDNDRVRLALTTIDFRRLASTAKLLHLLNASRSDLQTRTSVTNRRCGNVCFNNFYVKNHGWAYFFLFEMTKNSIRSAKTPFYPI